MLIPRSQGLRTESPQACGAPGSGNCGQDKPHRVVVQVFADGSLRVNQEDTTWDGLGPRMETIFKERAEKIAFVKGDSDVLFMDVARAIDIMRGAGIDKIGLITAKLEAGQ